jgi:hypothetical protein
MVATDIKAALIINKKKIKKKGFYILPLLMKYCSLKYFFLFFFYIIYGFSFNLNYIL